MVVLHSSGRGGGATAGRPRTTRKRPRPEAGEGAEELEAPLCGVVPLLPGVAAECIARRDAAIRVVSKLAALSLPGLSVGVRAPRPPPPLPPLSPAPYSLPPPPPLVFACFGLRLTL